MKAENNALIVHGKVAYRNEVLVASVRVSRERGGEPLVFLAVGYLRGRVYLRLTKQDIQHPHVF